MNTCLQRHITFFFSLSQHMYIYIQTQTSLRIDKEGIWHYVEIDTHVLSYHKVYMILKAYEFSLGASLYNVLYVYMCICYSITHHYLWLLCIPRSMQRQRFCIFKLYSINSL